MSRHCFTIVIVMSLIVLPQRIAEAQERTYGIHSALNISGFKGEDAIGASNKAGYAIGAFFNYSFTNTFSLQPEVAFTLKGANTNLHGGFSDAFSIFYLEIPVLAKYSFNSNASFKPHVLFGPAVSLYVGTGARTVVNDIVVAPDSFLPMDLFPDVDEPRSVDLGLMFGGGFDYDKFHVDVRYNIGLAGIDRERNDLDIRNRVFSVVIGYSFRR